MTLFFRLCILTGVMYQVFGSVLMENVARMTSTAPNFHDALMTNPDFVVARAKAQAAALNKNFVRHQKPDLLTTTYVDGFVSYQFSYGTTCGSPKTLSVGIQSGVCFVDGTVSYSLQFSDNSCSNLGVFIYLGNSCTTYVSTVQINGFTSCKTYAAGAGTFYNSMKGVCTVGSTMTVPMNAAVVSVFSGSSSCSSSSPVVYAALATNLCLDISGTSGYADSAMITCSAAQIGFTNFTTSTTCAATNQAYTLPTGCYPATLTIDKHVVAGQMSSLSSSSASLLETHMMAHLASPETVSTVKPADKKHLRTTAATAATAAAAAVVAKWDVQASTDDFVSTDTFAPTFKPTQLPPVALKTSGPTAVPSVSPSVAPSAAPTTVGPTSQSPTTAPSETPSVTPSESPSEVPTEAPSDVPSVNPTVVPTVIPTVNPSVLPSVAPSMMPTYTPSVVPTVVPTNLPPTLTPSTAPVTVAPSNVQTIAPTGAHTGYQLSVSLSCAAANTPIVYTSSPSAAPTQQSVKPTMVPSTQQSVRPTRTPSTVGPTRLPTVRPTFLPTPKPTTRVPTPLPSTALPSLRPSSVRPTTKPSSVKPTIKPSTAVNTRAPSAKPFAMTVVPTSRVPTKAPYSSVAISVLFTVNQILYGLTYLQFQLNISLYVSTLKQSIVACMVGVTVDMIVYFAVWPAATSSSSRRLNNNNDFHGLTPDADAGSNSYVFINYTISNPESIYPYSTLSTELSTSISDGTFNANLNTYAEENSATGLVNCTSSEDSTVNELPDDPSDTNSVSSDTSSAALSSGGVAGVVIAVLLVGAGAVWAYYYFVVGVGSMFGGGSDNSRNTRAAQASTSGAELSVHHLKHLSDAATTDHCDTTSETENPLSVGSLHGGDSVQSVDERDSVASVGHVEA